MRKTIAVDFDGTLATRNKYYYDRIEAEPNEGALEALAKLAETYEVAIWTTRLSKTKNPIPHDYVRNYDLLLNWLYDHGFRTGTHYHFLTGDKIPGAWYVDDHAIHFTAWDQVLAEIAKASEAEQAVEDRIVEVADEVKQEMEK